MTLAIFDLDDTLIDGDCASLWSRRMAELGWADGDAFVRRCDEMMRAYGAGTLSMGDYMALTLAPLIGRGGGEVRAAVEAFVDDVIVPRMRADARRAVEAHRTVGDRLLVISASGAHLVEPIAARFGIDAVIAIDPELRDGAYTGRTVGVLPFREGKSVRLDAWLRDAGEALAGASFYSDSHNDLPLLGRVDRPHAVRPDPVLERQAREAGWPVLDWR
ncbi:HAD family hydrolase [Burkholderia sp. 22PA0099]|uniref:HAD family hydrolase n=1 Tax=Burkholderia sp. 22PA0099 TaxID=3237372 RepID=UPI0039C2C40A